MADIVLKGLEKILANYQRRVTNTNRVAAQITNKAGLMVKGHAEAIVPVDGGDLKGSISLDPAEVAAGGVVQARVYSDLEYAPYVEFGTGVRGASTSTNQPKEGAVAYSSTHAGQVAQPYMFPASEMTRRKIPALAIQEIKKGLK